MTKTCVLVLILTSLAFGALAQASPAPKYRVTEVAAPSEAALCLPGHAIRVTGGGVSDGGAVPGNLSCYGNSELANGVVLPTLSVTQAFYWKRATGATEVAPPPDHNTPYLFSIEAGGNVYGWMSHQATGLDGVRWTPGAGFATVLTKASDCFINVSLASAGNAAGNVVGAAFRQDGVSEFPGDFTCVLRWVFRDALGNEIVGPAANQIPSRMNRRNVVVGRVNNSATKWLPLRNNELVTLDQASPGFTSYAYGVNNLNVVVGASAVDTGVGTCWSNAVGMVWGRDNEGRSLPSLPRMTNSEAWAIDDESTIYGFSSMGADICEPRSWEANRATIWRRFRAHDLNKLLVGRPGVTLTNAAHVNSKGQIVAYGFRSADPLKSCPEVGYPDDGGDPYLIPGQCRDQRIYLLSPL
jgi:uncharacterized membrane protein